MKSPGRRMRVVSLVPSGTETLLSLGVDVVACTRFCEQPTIRHVGGTKNPNVDEIIEIAPDLVVLDREENRIEDHDALVAAGLRVFVSEVTDVEGALDVVERLATEAQVEPPERSLLDVAASTERSTAFVPIWRRPWMTISDATYGGSLLQALGVDLVEFDSTDVYPTVELADVAARGPDLVLVPSEPYDFGRSHLDEIGVAIPSARIVRIDGQDLFWWGSRTPGALSRLAAALGLRPTQ